MMKTDYWTLVPDFVPGFVFEPLLKIMIDYCHGAKRKSCVFHGIHSPENSLSEGYYYGISSYKWDDAPNILHEICKLVEQYTKESYDYVLIHIYPDGNASIGWHNDKEALDSSVVSISLGATRKFRLKPIEQKQGWETELQLKDGDMLWMHGPDPISGRLSCQNTYLHTVPVEKKVKQSRINLTFRRY